MEIWEQRRYVLQAGQYLERFAAKGEGTYNFRCPYCHDSKKNKYLCRGYFHVREDRYYFKCQNCGESRTLGNFLKDQAPSLYSDFVMAKMGSKRENPDKFSHKEKKKPAAPDALKGLKTLAQLPPTHEAVRYITGRKIPTIWLSRLYYAPDFTGWVDTILPGKLNTKIKESRIIIPLINEHNEFIGAQGRSLSPFIEDRLRYISVALPDHPQIFGMDLLDKKKPVYIFEGPFDAMFIPNSIALTGASKGYDGPGTYVLDNQPRNKEIVRLYKKLIAAGKTVFIWPTASDTKEDLNDLVKRGMIIKDLQKMIDENSFSGLMAELKLAKWMKV